MRVFLQKWEVKWSIVFEFKLQIRVLLKNVIFIILLCYLQRSLADWDVFDRKPKVQDSVTYDVVRTEEITIEELQREIVILIFASILEWEFQPVIEWSLPVCASIVSVSLFRIVWIEESSHKIVTRLKIFFLFKGSSVYSYSNFKIFCRLWWDVIFFNLISRSRKRENIKPQPYSPLWYSWWGMIKLPILNRFILDAVPIRRKISIFQIYWGLSN